MNQKAKAVLRLGILATAVRRSNARIDNRFQYPQIRVAVLGHEVQLLPRWFVFGSYGVAAALFLVATLDVWLVVVFPLWVLVLNGIIWFHGRTIAQEPTTSASPL